MGFFSWNCSGCGHSLLSAHATSEHNQWMTDIVVLTKDGSVIKGEYDGYGRCDDMEFWSSDEPEVYHKACWELVGKPTEFKEASKSARDQGYFFDGDAHNVHEPKSLEDLHNIKVAGDLAEKYCCDSWKIAHLEYIIGQAHEELVRQWCNNEDKTKSEAFKIVEEHIKQRNEREKKQEELRKQREEQREKEEEEDEE